MKFVHYTKLLLKTTSRKAIMALLALVVIGAPIFYLTLLNSKETKAAWFDENWLYRAAVPISSHTNAENNVYITVTIDTSTPIAASKMQTDCGDLRFTKENGEILPYFINASPGCNNAATTIQVNFDSFPAGAQTIYYYYGNASAANGFNNAGFSTAATGVTIGSVGSEAQGPGPVAYWKFDDGYGTNAQDSSSSGLDGTITAATWQTEDQCISGKCLKFDGTDDYVQTSSTTDLTTFTASAWIRPTALSGTNAIISHGGSPTDNGWSFETQSNNKTLRLTFHGVGNYDSNLNILSTNTWQHVAVTLTGTTATFYLNGKQVGTATTGSLGVATHIYSIGAYPAGTNDYSGFIDEPKVYNYVRTAAQIKTDYLSGKANAGTKQGTSAVLGAQPEDYLSNGLIGYWKTDESSGNAADSSGNGLTLTNNSVMAYAAGKFGNSVQCDGIADYLNTATTISGIQTVSFWAYPAAAANNYFINLINSSAYITINSSGVVSATGFTSPSIYVNGVPNGTATAAVWNLITVTTDTSINANAFAVGLTNDGANNFCTNTSKIDEVRAYNRALSPKEVSDLYNFAPGPVGYWRMDDKVSGNGQTLVDVSGKGYNLTSYWGANAAGMDCTRSGKFGGGCSFDGTDDYATVTDNNDLDLGANATLEVWVKPNSLPTSGNLMSILEKYLSTDPWGGWDFRLYNNSGTQQLDFTYYNTNTVSTTTTYSTAPLPTNTWSHLAAVHDSTAGTDTIYLNGIQVAQNTGRTLNIKGSNKDLTIGNFGTLSRYFNGVIDDVKIYNYARSAKQVVQDMNASHPAVGSPIGSAVGYWKFDEGADNKCSGGTNDTCNSGSQGSTLDGAESGMAVPATSTSGWTNSGKFGKALLFDGSNDYITVSNNSALQLSSQGTLSAWINLASSPTAWGVVMAKRTTGSASGYEYELDLSSSGTTLRGLISNGTSNGIVSGSTTLSTGTWYHAVFVWDGSNLKLYLNGKPEATTPQTFNAQAATNPLEIGRGNDPTPVWFKGTIDEVKIYNYALTADEVKLEYNRGQSLVLGAAGDNSTYQPQAANQEYCVPGDSTSCAAPVGRWDFEEKNGTAAYDTSGNGKTGTLTDKGGSTLPAWKTGKIGSALDFDGSADYVNIPSPNLPTGDFTYETWVNLDDVSDETILMSLESATSTNEIDLSVNTGGKAQVIVNNTTAILTGAGYVSTGAWTHLSFTRSGSTVTLYKNGVVYSTTGTEGTTLNFGNCNFLIGVDSDNNGNNCTYSNDLGNWADGRIDEVRIFNYARSAAQIAWDYNRGKPVGHWKMDECQGTQAYDSSGNSNTGTITIGATGTQTAVGTCTGSANTAWKDGATGKRNASLDFDGTDDYVDLGNSSTLNPTTAMTISAWVKFNSLPDILGTEYWVVGRDQSTGRAYVLGVRLNAAGANYRAELQINGNATIRNQTGTDLTSTGTWYHLVATGDSTNGWIIYIDGTRRASASWLAPNSVTTNTNIARRTYSGANGYAPAQIDDVKIFNYALTATQVKDIMNEGAVRFGPSTGSP